MNETRNIPAESPLCPKPLSEPAPNDPSVFGNNQPPQTTETDERARRWVKRACKASIVFLVLVLFVFRENQHTRELYQMSRMVTAAEAERRQWQEKLRLAEGRTAGLVAVMHSQRSLSQNPKAVPASYVVPARWR